MTLEQQETFKEIVGLCVSASNALLDPNVKEGMKDFIEYTKRADDLFIKNFPDRPLSDMDEVHKNCRGIWCSITHQPYMTTFTGRREMWGHFF